MKSAQYSRKRQLSAIGGRLSASNLLTNRIDGLETSKFNLRRSPRELRRGRKPI